MDLKSVIAFIICTVNWTKGIICMSLVDELQHTNTLLCRRFIQRRVMWGSSSDRHRGQRVDALRNYLNLRPEQYDRTLNQCLWGAEKCAEEADLIYYSKEEGAADLSGYDWLITGDPR